MSPGAVEIRVEVAIGFGAPTLAARWRASDGRGELVYQVLGARWTAELFETPTGDV